MSNFEECTEHLLLLASGPTPTNRLASRAGVLVSDYWELLDTDQRERLRVWLDVVHKESLRPVFGYAMQEKARLTAVITAAIDALKEKAPPERG
jgi:hypothetical protein